MTRKEFLRLSAASPLAAAAQTTSPAPPPNRPNVLVLLSDQHRYDLMTCAGRDLVPTPALDRIAARGVRVDRAWCPYPVCVGSRMSLLTGLYAHTHGAVSNEKTLPWRARTVAHHFRDHGYLTGLIGKMHFNNPLTHGFDYHLSCNDWLMYLGPQVPLFANDIASHQHGPQFFHTVVDHGSGFPELPELWGIVSPWARQVTYNGRVASELPADDHIDAFVARETVRFLKEHKNEPFFLISGFLKPHPPFHPPPGWAENLYDPATMPLAPVGDTSKYPQHIRRRIERIQSLGPERLRSGRAGYLGNLAFLDHCVGQVYDALVELGLDQNTVVVYTSDHGDMDGDHGLYQKFVLYEPSVAVPLIVSYPAALPQGKVSEALTEYFGLYPTLSELAGLPTPKNLDARSFAEILRNPDLPGPEAIFSEYALDTQVPFYSVRTRDFQYIYNDGDIPELYDMQADPGQTFNRAGDDRFETVRRQLQDTLFDWYNPQNNPYRPRKA